jgi:hypothetical protein
MANAEEERTVAQEPRISRIEAGEWEGEYTDVNGHRGKLRFALEVAGDDIRGTYQLILAEEDQPEVISGRVQGGMAGSTVRFRAVAEAEKQEGRAEVQYEAQIAPAGSYARQALFGVVSAAPQANFGGGVWIAWRFDRPAGR